MGVYLDYNASSPIDHRVLETMIIAYKEIYGNADSRTHEYGDYARQAVENAREQVALLLGVNKDEVFFTSGSTESNNIAIQGLRKYGVKEDKKHIIISSIEHKSTLNAAKSLEDFGFEIQQIIPDISGRVKERKVMSQIKEKTLLVSIMHVNNETGIIQPVKEIGEELTERNIFFHIDATQSCGKLVDEIRNLKYDMLSISAHKFGGPQGIGALILRKKKYKLPPVKPIMFGGQQEQEIRPGTIPVALCVGMGEACRIASEEYEEHDSKNRRIKSFLISMLNESGIPYGFNGDQEYCVSNTMNIYFDGVASEALMLASRKFCGISNGSACNSHSYSPSFVLEAMGVSNEIIDNSIRISWGKDVNVEDLKDNFFRLLEVAKMLKV